MSTNIHIQIDRIILEGIDISISQRRQLKATLVAELSRLFSEHHLPPSLNIHNAISKLSIDMSLSQTTDPKHLGKFIAQSVYGRCVANGINSCVGERKKVWELNNRDALSDE